MKSKLLLAVVTCCILNSAAKSQIYSDSVISSTNTTNPQNAVNANDTDYATMSAPAGVGNSASLRLGFYPYGFGGMISVLKIQSVKGSISGDILDNLDVSLYNKDGDIVGRKDSFTIADLTLLPGTTNIYTINVRAKNSPSKVTAIKITLKSLTTADSRLRVYEDFLRFKCTGIQADAVVSSSRVNQPDNAVDDDDLSYALMSPPLNGYSNLTASFSDTGTTTNALRFLLGEENTAVTAQLLSNIKLTAYDAAGNLIAAKNNFSLSDIQIAADGKFSVSIPLPHGSVVATAGIRFQGDVNILNTLQLYSIKINNTQLNVQPKIVPGGESTICSRDSIRLFAKPDYEGQNIMWQWYKNNAIIDGATKQRYYANSPGKYFVVVSNDNDCKNISDDIAIKQTNCFASQSENVAKLNTYPNPFTSYTTLSLSNVKTSGVITVSDKSGNIVQTANIKGTEQIKLLVNVSPGVYYIKLITKEGDVYSTKVLKL